MKGNTIKFYCWVKSSTASHARIGISNGSSITYSDYHPGDGDWNLLKAEYTSALSDTALFPTLAVANTNAAYFSDSWIQGVETLLSIRGPYHWHLMARLIWLLAIRATTLKMPSAR